MNTPVDRSGYHSTRALMTTEGSPIKLYFCTKCGAVVGNCDWHDNFHRKLDDAVGGVVVVEVGRK